MTGGANNLASFMQKVKIEREKTNAKLDNLFKKLDRLETQVCMDGGASEKLLDNLRKKVVLIEKQFQDIDHELKTSNSFKKKQMQTLVSDIDELLKNKGEFKQKTDYLFEKIQEISRDVDQKMLKVISEFEEIKTPIMNKVNDVFEVSKLYHHEITRTQNINREMLIDMSKINQDYEACLEKTASIDHNYSQMHNDPMAMSIFSNQVGGGGTLPGS